MRIELPPPHSEGQKDLILSKEMDVVFAGRRWGKTHSGVQRIIFNAIADPGLYWWVGLGWKSASLKRAWRELKNIALAMWEAFDGSSYQSVYRKYIRESAKEIILPNKAEIWMRTAERPDSLAGEGVKGVVIDEFTLMREEVWGEYVEATLLDHNGWAMFIGVPKGNNWGGRLWRQAPDRKGWNQHHFPTSANPAISLERLGEIEKHTPAKLFQQEYLAEIVDGAGIVFSGIYDCIIPESILDNPTPNSEHTYIFGLDWGKNNDWTVLTIMDADEKKVVHIDRFNDISYPVQLERIRGWNDLYQPRMIVAEANAMGDPLCEQLMQDGLPIEKFWSTNKSKREVIEHLVVAFEQKEIGIPEFKPLIGELEVYESRVTPSGNISYNAPEGEHDDCVVSLALAWHIVRHDTGITF